MYLYIITITAAASGSKHGRHPRAWRVLHPGACTVRKETKGTRVCHCVCGERVRKQAPSVSTSLQCCENGKGREACGCDVVVWPTEGGRERGKESTIGRKEGEAGWRVEVGEMREMGSVTRKKALLTITRQQARLAVEGIIVQYTYVSKR